MTKDAVELHKRIKKDVEDGKQYTLTKYVQEF